MRKNRTGGVFWFSPATSESHQMIQSAAQKNQKTQTININEDHSKIIDVMKTYGLY